MKYTKPALTCEQQAQLLIARGLIVKDPSELVNYLLQVNYYRLSGYWYEFKLIDQFTGEESFKAGTTFQVIKDRYEFDRQLRLLFMNAIERIEVAVFRTQLVEANTLKYGPFGYTDVRNYNPKFIQYDLDKLLKAISEDEGRSYEEFIRRYRSKYTEETFLPLWMVVELMAFNHLLTLYKNQDLSIKQAISHRYSVFPPVLDSWLLALNAVRNSCAHHNRFWNRPLPLKPMFPDQKRDPHWYTPAAIPNDRIYTALTIINYLLSFIAPDDQWKTAVGKLLAAYPEIPLLPMGIPIDWQESPLWK